MYFDMKARYLSILGKLMLGLLLSLTVSAAEPVTSGSVTIPNPPKAKTNFSAEQPCVEPIDVMRRGHGLFLKHYRHDTVRYGIRTLNYSLVTCINCHVTPDEHDNYPDVKNGTEHFCRSCHSYAAVTIDCFQCHASHPDEEISSFDRVNEVSSIKLDSLGTP